MKGVAINDDLTVDPLTDDELRWVRSLQRVLAKCPRRLVLATYGSRYWHVVDEAAARDRRPFDPQATLASLDGGPAVYLD